MGPRIARQLFVRAAYQLSIHQQHQRPTERCMLLNFIVAAVSEALFPLPAVLSTPPYAPFDAPSPPGSQAFAGVDPRVIRTLVSEIWITLLFNGCATAESPSLAPTRREPLNDAEPVVLVKHERYFILDKNHVYLYIESHCLLNTTEPSSNNSIQCSSCRSAHVPATLQ